MYSFGLCPQHIHYNNIAVNGGVREFGINKRDTQVDIQA